MASRWTLEETRALLEAWVPRQRRRQAQGDPWARPQRRSSFNLVDEDWRDIADAVNRDGCANRTAEQCKSRMKYLRTRYAVELLEKKASPWPLFAVVHPFFTGETPSKPAKGESSSPADAAEEDGDPSSAAAAAAAAAVPAAERGNDGEAGGSRAAAGTTRSSLEAVLMKISDGHVHEHVMVNKFLEVVEAVKGSRN